MLQARLERLEPEARQVLRAASVFEQPLWGKGVQPFLGGDGTPSSGTTRSLSSDREWIVRRATG